MSGSVENKHILVFFFTAAHADTYEYSTANFFIMRMYTVANVTD